MTEVPAQCHVCKDNLDPLLDPGFGSVWNGKIGYRCTDCERLFCAACIKGKGHVNTWQAPCTDAESEAWTKAVVEAPGLRRRVKELESQADEREGLLARGAELLEQDAKEIERLRTELAAAKLSLWQYTRPSGYDVNGRTYGEAFGSCSHSVLLFRDCEQCDAGSGRPRLAKVVT